MTLIHPPKGQNLALKIEGLPVADFLNDRVCTQVAIDLLPFEG